MFSYSGSLEEVGPGRNTSALLSTRGYVKIDGQRIRGVTVTDFMDGLLAPGEKMTLSMGFIFFRRWLLAVRRDGEVLREGLFVFLGGLMTHLVGVTLVGGLITLAVGAMLGEAAATVAGIGLVIYGLGTAAINVKAWLAPA
ncbi:MAG: hypothetical protein P8080_13050 [Gammaproteobacteria bacterium]